MPSLMSKCKKQIDELEDLATLDVQAHLQIQKWTALLRAIIYPNRLPLDIELYIVPMLLPSPSPSLLRYGHDRNGFTFKLLPHPRVIHPPTDMTSIERSLFELRQHFSVKLAFDSSNYLCTDYLHGLSKPPRRLFFLLLCAFGSVAQLEHYLSIGSSTPEEVIMNMCISVKYANFPILAYFLEHLGQRPLGYLSSGDARFTNVLGFAAEFGYLHLVRHLVERVGSNPGAHGNHAIRFAATNGHLEVVKYLCLHTGTVDPASHRNYALRMAAKNKHLGVLRFLLEELTSDYDVDPAAENNFALTYACLKGHLSVVEYLLTLDRKYGLLTVRHNEALVAAASEGHLDVVRCLMKAGVVDVLSRDQAALRSAAEFGRLDVVEYLLDMCPEMDPTIRDNDAVILAAANGHLEVVEYLVKHYPVNLCAQNHYALRLASSLGHVSMVR